MLAHPAVTRGELAPFADDIARYVVRATCVLALRAAASGRVAAARQIIEVMAAHGAPVRALAWRSRVLAAAPVRPLTGLRRRLASWRATRLAARAGRLPLGGGSPA